jgi:hypothetical protein
MVACFDVDSIQDSTNDYPRHRPCEQNNSTLLWDTISFCPVTNAPSNGTKKHLHIGIFKVFHRNEMTHLVDEHYQHEQENEPEVFFKKM